jgi:hypothetical protein
MKNVGREFATMDDDERRRFAQEPVRDPDGDRVHELNYFDDPRDADHMGEHIMPEDPLRAEEEILEMEESGALPEGVPEERRRQPRRRKGR